MEEVGAGAADLLGLQHRAAAAAQILEHQLFREAVAAVKNKADREFLSAKPDDDRGRLAIQMKMVALNDVIRELREFVRDGKIAEHRAEQLKRKRVA